MTNLDLTDLTNPRHVVAVMDKAGTCYEAGPDQGWQDRPGSWELWQRMENGLLLRIRRWRKTSIIATYRAEP